MALSITHDYDSEDFIGSKTKKLTARIVGDSSYPTGGYSSFRSKFGLSKVDNFIAEPLTDAAAEYKVRYDFTNDKLMVYNADNREQISDTTSVTDFDFRITLFGY